MTGALLKKIYRTQLGHVPTIGMLAGPFWNPESAFETGRFLTMLPRYTLMLPGKHPSLKALPVELANSQAPMAIVTLNKRTLSPLADVFIKTVRAVTKPLTRAR